MMGIRPWKSSHVCQDSEHYVGEFEMCKFDVGSISLKILWRLGGGMGRELGWR